MSWGSALSGAWNAATEGARAAANAIANTARAAYDYVAGRAAQAAAFIENAVSGLVSGLINVAVRAYNAVVSAFDGSRAGGATSPCPHAGGGGSGGGASGGGACHPEDPDPPAPVDDYNIVSVAWLNGDDATTIGDCTQYVNLPRDAKWLTDSGIPNIDRLGISPRFLVTFDRPGSFGFQWKIVPEPGGTPAYTATEEGRNANFIASSKEWGNGSTAADGRAIMADAARLVAGGGFKFRIKAKDDKGKEVQSGVITTRRLFWYVELPMSGLTSVLSSTATVDSEYATHHIELKQLADLAVPHQENIGNDTDSGTLSTNVNAAVAGSATASTKSPYLLRIAYTDHLAVKNPNRPQRSDGVTVGPGQPQLEIPVSSTGLRSGDGEAARWLWLNLVTGESWFVSAQYIPDDGSATVNIPADKVSALGAPAGGSSQTVAVDVTGLPAGTGSVVVNVNVVDRMRGGLAFGGSADICICTRSWWRNSTDAKQVCTVIHEMGHQVKQVSDGTGNQPDRVATQYDNSGHVGSHCHNGCAAGQANYATSANVTASTCPMFGTVNQKTAFCGNCAPAVKKVDLGSGF